MADKDPFAGLEDWGKKTEKRVRRERRQRFGFGLLALVVAGLVIVAVVPGLKSAVLGNRESADGAVAYPTQSVPPGVSVKTTQSAKPTSAFAGTPAANYPKGAAGITMPAAARIGVFSAAQVGADLKKVRAAMIAGRLDPDMLTGHEPDKYLAMLAPSARGEITGWFAGKARSSVATWIDPAVHLDPAESPRVSGRTTYRTVEVGDLQYLRITTNYVWVYAFEGPRHPLAAEHDQIDWDFPDTRHLVTADRGMWIRNAKAYGALVDCAAGALGLLAPTPEDSGRVAGPSDTEDPENYLRADHSLDIGDDCGNSPR